MSSEHRAVLLLFALGVAGQVIRLIASDPTASPGDIQLLGSAGTSAVVARRDSLARHIRPLGPGDRIDVDRAPAHELTRLPGVGPTLAQRIVSDRERSGPFGDVVALSRVRGVGAAVVARMAPHLTFSGAVLAVPADSPKARKKGAARVGKAGRAGAAGLPLAPSAPYVMLPRDHRPATNAPQPGPLSPVLDVLNRGNVADLDKLPGIGRVRAERIVAFRDSAGAFQSAEDLARVPGISLALARRLWTVAGRP